MEDKTFIEVAELVRSLQEKIDNYELFERSLLELLINDKNVKILSADSNDTERFIMNKINDFKKYAETNSSK